ncbi:RDD family protein [Sanguibacter sp. HDW7]|uniref:RDD family protein n=1 Tax=Sanguibacter sp. HDW7 TaxID=2714931 RepID=UPI00140A902C|nr:RDD family protein [Sanguibacter sp. HDW7]QIK83731.1 RDD family protein [Sanguibacter sp. HDW7]
MVSRDDIGSWLEGAPAGDGAAGERLGLPPEGPGSLATLGRRIPALFVDWFACMGVSALLFDGDAAATLLVFLVENVLLVAFLGFTLGHRVLGIGVRRVDGATFVGPLRAAVRAVLLCLVIPAVVWDGDGRGLHDRGAGTVLVRR